jgi:Rps23 Pro-64 3,4-dihydroxylase Tpa1-like proline 4-hydroxylase
LHPHWGGVLICFDPASEGIAHVAILPKRNRLVLLRNPIRHLVTPVAAEAGAHRRLACAGYYRASPSP